jgi:hypothetical protein
VHELVCMYVSGRSALRVAHHELMRLERLLAAGAQELRKAEAKLGRRAGGFVALRNYLHSCCLLLEREGESTRMCELSKRSDSRGGLSRVCLVGDRGEMAYGGGPRVVDFNKHLLGRRMVHSAYLHQANTSRSRRSTRQGLIAMDILPLAFMLRLPQQAYDARQDAAM